MHTQPANNPTAKQAVLVGSNARPLPALKRCTVVIRTAQGEMRYPAILQHLMDACIAAAKQLGTIEHSVRLEDVQSIEIKPNLRGVPDQALDKYFELGRTAHDQGKMIEQNPIWQRIEGRNPTAYYQRYPLGQAWLDGWNFAKLEAASQIETLTEDLDQSLTPAKKAELIEFLAFVEQ